MSRVCLVGAGFISHVHAAALRRVPGQTVSAVVDPNTEAATRLARACGNAQVFASVAEALAADAFDRAHVLVPPDLHAATALPLLAAGKPVLLEKPLATSPAEAQSLLDAAAAGSALLGVNQNFVHHPAFVGLRDMLARRALGRPRHVACTYNMPLRQLAARQFGHWMFHAPGNILLEQAVHPLSLIAAIAGPIGAVQAQPGTPVQIAPGVAFYPTVDATLACRDLPAQLRFAVGCAFPFWQVSVVCDDGVITADIAANRLFSYANTRWIEALDGALSAARTGAAIGWAGLRNMAGYALATTGLSKSGNPFQQSMHGSIAAFHAAADRNTPPALDGAFGANLVQACAAIAAAFPTPAPVAARPAPDSAPCDVAVLGGTGFIGAWVVRRLLADGKRVAVMARNLRNLPAIFDDPRVTLHRGSITDAAAVARAIAGCSVVVNLAHGGASGGWEAIRDAMLGGAETVARACQQVGVRRLIHVGSIASLYLGPQAEPVTGRTAPDAQEEKRGDYARAKVLCDRMLLKLHADEGLPVAILRPGVVVGEGASPFHSGLGLFNNERHCIGWNAGRNALPFVLVEDVADAVVLACDAEGIEGKCFNLVGDVRPDARAYIARLGRALERPLAFHPQAATWLWLEDSAKWVIKRASGRKIPAPAKRDFLSRGMTARFDCADAKQALGWQPVSEAETFWQRAVGVHAG